VSVTTQPCGLGFCIGTYPHFNSGYKHTEVVQVIVLKYNLENMKSDHIQEMSINIIIIDIPVIIEMNVFASVVSYLV